MAVRHRLAPAARESGNGDARPPRDCFGLRATSLPLSRAAATRDRLGTVWAYVPPRCRSPGLRERGGATRPSCATAGPTE
ncbi:Os03g0630933 [Oryza sativa Japonica Group]|uniref:Os03g0630933 protein n=1 Tax=Oryza sativa subsp. japonica TaxID=39947 RepID=A0A0P0W1C1_ORYSJ|nr:Os03g0630933 [Oryza sativa Japonica Group]